MGARSSPALAAVASVEGFGGGPGTGGLQRRDRSRPAAGCARLRPRQPLRAPGPSGGDSVLALRADRVRQLRRRVDDQRGRHGPDPAHAFSRIPTSTRRGRPTAAQIAFRSEPSGEPEIRIMNADGTAQRRLTDGLSPAWSPDGSADRLSSPGHDRPSVIGPDMDADRSGSTCVRTPKAANIPRGHPMASGSPSTRISRGIT